REPEESIDEWRKILKPLKLSHLVPPPPPAEAPIWPAPVSAEEDPGWLDTLVAAHRIGNIMPVASLLLQRAASINPPRSRYGEISTTRLLIAIHDVGRELDTRGTANPYDDASGTIALARVLGSGAYLTSYRKIVSHYMSGAKVPS